MKACEDEFAPYNVTGHLFRRDCTVGHLGFEAFYCIKIKGVKSTFTLQSSRLVYSLDLNNVCGHY